MQKNLNTIFFQRMYIMKRYKQSTLIMNDFEKKYDDSFSVLTLKF